MKTFLIAVVMNLVASVAGAEWVYDFRLPYFNPQNAQSIVFNNPPFPRITVKGVGPNINLYWDTADGIGISGPSYSDDEVEGPNEVLAVIFDRPVRIIAIGLSDFFYESEAYFGAPPCYVIGWFTCYQERGEFSYDGGVTWHSLVAPYANMREVTNGEYTLNTFLLTQMLLFRAPGRVVVPGFPYPQLHEFALKSITLKSEF